MSIYLKFKRNPEYIDASTLNILLDRISGHGGEIIPNTNPYELLRFRLWGSVHVIYKSKRGICSYSSKNCINVISDLLSPDRKIVRRHMFASWETVSSYRPLDRCFYCGTPFASNDTITKEHLLDVSKGGSNHPDNIVPSCSSCNTKAATNKWSVVDKVLNSYEARHGKL